MTSANPFPHPDLAWEPGQPFWAAAAVDQLHLPRCSSCDRLCWYPRDECPRCAGVLAWGAVDGHASLFAWVVVERPFLSEFASVVPFVPALVALDEDPAVRIVTRIVDADADELRVGLALEVTFRELTFDQTIGSTRAPFFRPAR